MGRRESQRERERESQGERGSEGETFIPGCWIRPIDDRSIHNGRPVEMASAMLDTKPGFISGKTCVMCLESHAKYENDKSKANRE